MNLANTTLQGVTIEGLDGVTGPDWMSKIAGRKILERFNIMYEYKDDPRYSPYYVAGQAAVKAAQAAAAKASERVGYSWVQWARDFDTKWGPAMQKAGSIGIAAFWTAARDDITATGPTDAERADAEVPPNANVGAAPSVFTPAGAAGGGSTTWLIVGAIGVAIAAVILLKKQ